MRRILALALVATAALLAGTAPVAASLLREPPALHAAAAKPLRHHQVRSPRLPRRPLADARAEAFQPLGNASVSWRTNVTFGVEHMLVGNLQRSVVASELLVGYAWNLNNESIGCFFGLNETTGAELWHAPVEAAQVPQYCQHFLETASTVACLGQSAFAVANKSGAAVAAGLFAPPGYQLANSRNPGNSANQVPAKLTMRDGDHLGLLLNNGNNRTVAKAALLDLVTGAVTPMGDVSSPGRLIQYGMPGALRRASDGHVEWPVVYWAQNYMVNNASCNDVFTATFSTTGKVATAHMPFECSNVVVPYPDMVCGQLDLFAYPDADLVLIRKAWPGTSVQGYALNGTFRYAVTVPTLEGFGTGGILKQIAGPSGAPALLYSAEGLALMSIDIATNATNWESKDQQALSNNINPADLTDTHLTVGGPAAQQMSNFTLATGVAWHTKLWYSFGCYFEVQRTSLVDACMCSQYTQLVRRSDGVKVAALDLTTVWREIPRFSVRSQFVETPSAPAGTGSLLAFASNEVVSVAITPLQ